MKFRNRVTSKTGFSFNGTSGFTLVEVSITLFIIGIVILAVTPKLSAVLSTNPTSIARRLAGTVRSCREKSIMTHRPFRIVLEFKEQKYYVETIDEESFSELKFVPDNSIMHRAVFIPKDIKVLDVVTPVSGKTIEGTAYIPVFQDGLFPGAIVHVQDSSEEQYTLVFMPLTGRLRFEKGYLFQEIETETNSS